MAYVVFSPFASVALIVFVLPILVGVEIVSACIDAAAVDAAVGDVIAVDILDIVVAGLEDRMI